MNTNLLSKEFNETIAKDNQVIAVLLFGSHVREEPFRDIDICLVLDKKYANLEMSKKRLKYSSLLPSRFDIQIFQQLPIYIRKRILKEGKPMIIKDDNMLYEIAFQTIKEFEFYKKIYYNYLDSMMEAK